MEIDEEGVLVSGQENNSIKVYPGGIDTAISQTGVSVTWAVRSGI